MSFGGLFDGGGGPGNSFTAALPAGAISHPRLLSGLSLGLQTNMEGGREMSRMGIGGGGGSLSAGDGNNNNSSSNKREETESRSGSDNVDGGGSGDDLEQGNPRKKKRYHRHTPQQIQELESLFKECPHPDEKQRLDLSKRLNLEGRQVKFWFQNRRTQMKTQIERHENSILKQENDKLRAENMSIKEAMRNPICENCGGPAILGEVSLEEQHLRIENARLKDELDRVCTLAGKFLGRPLPSLCSSLDLAVGGGGYAAVAPTLSVLAPDFASSPLGSVVTPPMGKNGMGMDRTMLLELALVAMDELVKMAHMEEPLWVGGALNYEEYLRGSPRCLGPKPAEYVSEATRETGMVIVNSMALVETLMDSTRWADMFPCMIAGTTTTDIISCGMAGTRNGALQLMHAELQVLSPLVPIREVSFLRFCKQHAEGVWAVVDVSVDGFRELNAAGNGNMSCRRLPSGCLVQDMPNGYSKVTWVEHAEYDEGAIHHLYRPLLRSGMGLGAQRWIATLQRQCECLAILMSSSIGARDHTAITAAGRRSMLKLAQRMTDNFCAGVCASSAHKWSRLTATGSIGEDVRVMTRQSLDDPGEPPGVVLSAATSVWLPLSPQRIFDFLRDERLRSEWDILSNGGPMQEMAHIAKGQDHGNAVSLLRASAVNANQSSMLILQETCTDASGSMVVYAPVDIPAMHLVMNRHPRLAEKRSIYNELYVALHHVVDLVPLAPMILKDIIDKRMPRSTDPKEVIVMFVECMLGLESDEIGEFLGNTLMAKVVELLVDLDVNINWEDILHEEHNKGIFDMDLEDVDENAHSVAGVGTKLSEESGKALNGNVFAEKLDSLMVIVCEHLESCASDGNLVKAFETLAETFRRTVMNAYKSKFVQFVMFYACSLDPEICGLKFAVMLTDIFVSNTEDPISRMSSVAYLASYLSRAKFIPSSLVASILKRLVDWCLEYCQFRDGWERTTYPKAHRVFYSGCQAVMYILCFRMRSLMDVPHLRSQLFHLSLEPILCSSLDPLKVCLPTIVQEFLRQAKAANLFRTSATFLYNNLLESEFSKGFGGMERLDMFFPFDPYLLKESDRFMRPNFEFWSMVKTTYRNGNSEDEEEDLDAPEDVNNAGPLDDDEDIDPQSESDGEVEYSLSKMSITPRPAFHYPMSDDIQNGSQMPARIRPSVSPDGC